MEGTAYTPWNAHHLAPRHLHSGTANYLLEQVAQKF